VIVNQEGSGLGPNIVAFAGKREWRTRHPRIPDTTVAAGLTYVYPVEAVDADNDVLTYSLTTGPDCMPIDPASGRLTWPTTRRKGKEREGKQCH